MQVKDLSVNQLIEIVLRDGEKPEYLPSRIEEITEQFIFISIPMRKGVIMPMPVGEEINVILRSKDRTFGFTATIAGRQMQPIPLLKLYKPECLESVNQKRDYVRLQIALPLHFQLEDTEGEIMAGKGVTVDISAGGMLFYTRSELHKEQKLMIELQLSPGNTIICQAHVLRVFERGIHEKNHVRAAIAYDDISEGQRDRIFKFIFAKQREWVQKGIV